MNFFKDFDSIDKEDADHGKRKSNQFMGGKAISS
jgi:hypothetical protein